jgi:AcrR family transcriptional regulator
VPRQVDHQERKREIVEALWRVTVRDGLGAVSFREVAAEADVSVRRVQYYFGTKAQLMLEALQLLGERIVARGMDGMQAIGSDPAPEAVLRAALRGAQPLDEESRKDLLLFFCFYIAALTDPPLAAATRASQRWIVPMFADLIRNAQQRGETWDGIDPDKEAATLLATNTGIALAVLSGLSSAEDGIAALEYRMAKIFRPTRRRPTKGPTRRN